MSRAKVPEDTSRPRPTHSGCGRTATVIHRRERESAEVWQDTADGADRRYPAHLDTILDPEFGEWWADSYGLARPPETFRRNRAYRDYQRRQSRWEVRSAQLRFAPPPRLPRGWRPGDEWRPDERDE